jgi:hypothetical protein
VTPEQAATIAEANIAAGLPIGAFPGVKVSTRAQLEKIDPATGAVLERITIEDDGSRTVETFSPPQE